jgi:hypothetical protein
MPHITDGLLHAYLDGAVGALTPAGEAPDGPTVADVEAHLQACVDCRARLEAERAVRAAAGLILADASGSVEVPPFEGLLTDTAIRGAPRRRRTWLPLAWAASLFLAVGAGWWAASSGGPSALPQRVAERTEARADPARTPGTAEADDADAGEPGAASVAGVTAAEPPPPAAPATADPRPAGAPTVGAAAVGVAADAAGAQAGRGATTPAADARVARVEAATEAAAGAADRVAARPVGEPVARAESTVVTGIAPPVTSSPLPPPSAVLRTAGAQRLRSEQSFQAGPVPDVVVSMPRAAGRVGDEWTHLGPEQRTVAGVPVVEVADAGATAAAFRVDSLLGTVIRVRQELAGGDSIELLIWRAQRPERAELSARAERSARSTAGGGRQAPPEAGAVGPVPVSGETRTDGERRLVVLLPDSDVLVALRGSVPDGWLTAISQRLVERR